jgi:hypothetical protein
VLFRSLSILAEKEGDKSEKGKKIRNNKVPCKPE